jgi:uncharacterized protein YjbJ (UPF0337 family)
MHVRHVFALSPLQRHTNEAVDSAGNKAHDAKVAAGKKVSGHAIMLCECAAFLSEAVPAGCCCFQVLLSIVQNASCTSTTIQICCCCCRLRLTMQAEEAKETARNVADQAKHAARDTVDSAKRGVSNAANNVREGAEGAADKAASKADHGFFMWKVGPSGRQVRSGAGVSSTLEKLHNQHRTASTFVPLPDCRVQPGACVKSTTRPSRCVSCQFVCMRGRCIQTACA